MHDWAPWARYDSFFSFLVELRRMVEWLVLLYLFYIQQDKDNPTKASGKPG
jgi:hypothetical protein